MREARRYAGTGIDPETRALLQSVEAGGIRDLDRIRQILSHADQLYSAIAEDAHELYRLRRDALAAFLRSWEPAPDGEPPRGRWL